jgi:serine/threonine-protein kinase RsbW
VDGAKRDGRWLWHRETAIPSDPVAGKQVLDELLDQLRAANWEQSDLFGIHLALEEALMNAIKHGNKYDAAKQVQVACAVSEERVRVEIGDEGPGFDLTAVPDCTDPDRLEVCSGRGLLLMRSFMTRVEFNGTGNRVMMEKDRSRPQ